MGFIEREIEARLERQELGPVVFQWADGQIWEGAIVACPHDDGEQHATWVPGGVFDEKVSCPQGHEVFVSHREGTQQITAQEPQDFSPPKLVSERVIQFPTWEPGSSEPDSG